VSECILTVSLVRLCCCSVELLVTSLGAGSCRNGREPLELPLRILRLILNPPLVNGRVHSLLSVGHANRAQSLGLRLLQFFLVVVAHRDVASCLCAVVAADDALERRLGASLLPVGETLLRHLDRLIALAVWGGNSRVVRLTERVLVTSVRTAVFKRHLVELLEIAGGGFANLRVFVQFPVSRNLADGLSVREDLRLPEDEVLLRKGTRGRFAPTNVVFKE